MLYASSSSDVTSPGPGRRLLRQLLDWVLPCPCLGCGQPVEEVRNSLGLCAACRRQLVRWPQPSCTVCGRPVAGQMPSDGRCGRCRNRTWGRVVSVWSYQPPLDAVLMALKFRRLDYLGTHLGRAMAALCGPRLRECELVVPVPLYWTRRLGRGYNQATAIARPLAAVLGLPLRHALRRRRPTPPQSRLPRAARAANLRGAFALVRAADCRGRQVLLVDDVTTTGATLEAAARCLRRGGVEAVVAITAARTPEAAHRPWLEAAATARDNWLAPLL